MPSTDTVIEKTARRTAKAAAKEAAKEAIMEMQLQDGDEGEDIDLETLDGNAGIHAEAADSAIGFDIFEDIGKPRTEKGEVIRYVVKKYGQHIATKYHPYTWEQLRKEFGPGQYQVIARSDSTNRYLKAQTQLLGQGTLQEDDVEDDRQAAPAAQTPPVNWQQPQMSFIEMFNLMQTQSDRARQEAQQQAQQQAQTQVAMITAMTEMMKNQQMQGQTLFMEMTKMTAQVAKEMSMTQEKLMEKLNSRMDKIAEVATKKPEGPTWLDVMKMNNESQNKGFELFEKLTRLAEIKAEEKLELVESAREANPEAAKKSMTDTLIESLLPVIAASMANSQAQNAALLQQQSAGALPGRAPTPQRGAVQRPQIPARRQAPPANGQVQRGPRTATAPAQAANQAVPRTKAKTGSGVIAVNGPRLGEVVVTKKKAVGLVIGDEGNQTQETGTIADKVEVLETSANTTNTVKERCREILPMFLGGLMLDRLDSDVAATKTIEFLADNEIDRDTFLANVDVKDLLAVAVEFELPKEAHEWLNELYAHIQGQSRDASGGESTPG